MSTLSITTSPEFMEALRLSLNHGFIKAINIINWADTYIAKEKEPADIILDISTCNPTGRDLDYLLSVYAGTPKPIYSSRILLSHINQKLMDNLITEERASEMLYNIALSKMEQPERDKIFCYPYNYQFYALQNFREGDIQKLKDSLRDFLSIFRPYRLDNFEDWQAIHKMVNDALLTFSPNMG